MMGRRCQNSNFSMKILYIVNIYVYTSTDYLSQLKNNQEQGFLDQCLPISFIFAGIGDREI